MLIRITTENEHNQIRIRVSKSLLLDKLGEPRAQNLIDGSSDNWAGANVYALPAGKNVRNKTMHLLISGHHKGEYKSTLDYLQK